MRHWLNIAEGFGKITAFFSLLMAMPAVVSVIFNDGLEMIYLSRAAGVFAVGALLAVIGRRWREELNLRSGFLLVITVWVILPAFAALPLMAILPNLSFVRAYFESTSGLTASGATVLSGLDAMPPSLNFWRAEMIWLGGMGLIVLAIAILPFLGVGGRGDMLQSEIPGPMKDQKLRPHITQVAKVLWLVYAGLTLLCALSYFAAGMNELDAVMHAFTTLGLGGFSSHDDSFAYFQSPTIEAVAVFFMVVAGMNFAAHFTAWSQKSIKPYADNLECMAYIKLLAAAVLTVTVYLYAQGVYPDWLSAFRHGLFNTVSIATTTGYSNTDYGAWPLAAPLFMLLLANITACSGSTGGGIKLIRFLITINQAKTERQKLLHPKAYYDNKTGVSLPQKIINSVLFFVSAYFATLLILMLLLTATGMGFIEAFSSALACLSNTGPALGAVGPAANYGALPPAQTALLAAAMLIGRLELLAFLVVLHRSFWRY